MAAETVKSAARVIEVLKVFATHRAPLSQSTLIETTSYPQSSMTALLKTMTASGLLHYNVRTRLYYPTILIKQLGEWIDDRSLEAPWVSSLMKSLSDLTGETVALGVRNDAYLTYLRAIESDHAVRYHIQTGEQRPLLDSSMGWLLLSRLEVMQVEKIYRRSPMECRQAAGDLDSFLARISEIGRQDHCFLPNVPAKAGSVSMMLPATFNESPIVIAVGGFIDRVSPKVDEIIAEMRNQISLHNK